MSMVFAKLLHKNEHLQTVCCRILLSRQSISFNKEAFVDFIAAQIKTLSFLAYIIRIYQEAVNSHSAQLVKGMLSLLTLCPVEVAHLRKELLIAARHILATDLRNSKRGLIQCTLTAYCFVLLQCYVTAQDCHSHTLDYCVIMVVAIKLHDN